MKQMAFGCELDSEELRDLFADPAVMDTLVELGSGVGMAVTDMSPERAAIVRRLNDAGILVGAWLLLPRHEGYWFNADNAPQAFARYDEFKAWTAEYGLRWEGVGIDVEPDFNEVQELFGKRRLRMLPVLVRRALDRNRIAHAQNAYRALVNQMRADGYRVETFQFPFMVDERKAGSSLIQRLFSLVDLQADRELLMLYSTFVPALGAGLLWSYAPEAQGIIIGITGKGVAPDSFAVPLNWEEFARDLRLAARWTDEIFIYSLEGCVQQGFLERLRDFDWEEPVALPLRSARQVNMARKAVQAVLWASAHPGLVMAGTLGLVPLLGLLAWPGIRR